MIAGNEDEEKDGELVLFLQNQKHSNSSHYEQVERCDEKDDVDKEDYDDD